MYRRSRDEQRRWFRRGNHGAPNAILSIVILSKDGPPKAGTINSKPTISRSREGDNKANTLARENLNKI
ncbi:hypothetical protein AYI69_g7622 [Smittium culicis]|uniref:Uncharacterized protein n=1 Tax=Smittium culicis TaxID=133412 RepID=A0A1R1XQR4_9FUNG|nr:hypothetical protein AYI69_g7622 [Smittium culicis]